MRDEKGVEDLNANAIYAALMFLRDYAKSDEGEADFRELLDRKSEKLEFYRSLVKGASKDPDENHAVFRPIPRFEITPALCESIYPNEQESVAYGLSFGRYLIWGPPSLAESSAQHDDPSGEAVRRFIADRSN